MPAAPKTVHRGYIEAARRPAIEIVSDDTFELVVAKDLDLAMPRAETPTHMITHGIDPDLDVAAKPAPREMIALICGRTGRTREQAYALCSIARDLAVTQPVNRHQGIHAMLPKAALGDAACSWCAR